MAASEVSRYVDRAAGAVLTQVDDGHGRIVTHTTYIAGVNDIQADIAEAVARIGADADAMQAKLVAAGLA